MSFYFEKSIVIGLGQFAFNCARYLHDEFRLDGVFEYGNYAQSRLEMLCKKSNFKYIKLFEKSECDTLMKEIFDSGKRVLIISAANTYIFPNFITQNTNVKIINHHPAFLTKHLGRNAEAWTIYEQNDVAGVTWHEVTSEIDHGAILAERAVILDKNITSIKLRIRQYQVGVEMFKQFIGQVMMNADISQTTVSDYGKLHYSYERPNEGMLDLTWDGQKMSAFLRSMDYGILNVLGRPFVIEGELKYSWNSYKILENLDREYDSDSRIIKKDGYYFVLQDYHVMENLEMTNS